MSKSVDVLQGTLDMLILKAVSLGPLHGYGTLLRIQQISKSALQIPQGSLHPALYRLEHKGWINSEWGTALGHAQGAAPSPDNPELKQIFDADRKDREGPSVANLDGSRIGARDAVRRKRVRELIEAGRLNARKDYERAAFVFQHGEGSDDILLAHILAVTAIGKGDLDARWIAAATMDRYLQRIRQPQVFGAQFLFTMENGQQIWTMGEFNRSLVPRELRDANCVPNAENQAAVLEALGKGVAPPEPNKRPCAGSSQQ